MIVLFSPFLIHLFDKSTWQITQSQNDVNVKDAVTLS